MSNNKEDAVIIELTQAINELTAGYRQFIGNKKIEKGLLSSVKERVEVIATLTSIEGV